MNKRASAFCISLLLLFTLTFQNLTIVRSIAGEEETEYYVKTTVTYSNKGNNGDKLWNFTEREEDRTIGLFMNNSWQTVYLVNSTHSMETKENDTDGNQVAVLQFPQMLLYPGENISYAVTYRVVSKPRTHYNINETASQTLDEIPPEFLKEKYLGAEGPWLVNDTELQNLARSIAGTETKILTIVKNLVNWIAENITYQTHEVPQYPNKTLMEREGDCDDQAILLVTLCRILGIPAFVQIGAIYLRDQSSPTRIDYWNGHLAVVQKKIGWHGWAIVYIPPWGWLPVDLTYVFRPIEEDPLNAIRNAAVTSQTTIQYMNVSQIDYVASSRGTREFLNTSSFYLHMEDEMVEIIRQKNPFVVSMEWLFPVFLVGSVALLLAVSYVLARRLKREEEIPTPP